MTEAAAVDLTNCDIEPIHIPGSIQPHGCLIACDMAVQTVMRHSVNAPDMLGLENDLNGRALTDILGEVVCHDIRNAVARSQEGARPALLFGRQIGTGQFDVAVHRFKGYTIIEIEAAEGALGEPLDLSRTMAERIAAVTSSERLIRDSARLIQALLNYDRVMIYKFGPDGAGKVISEAKRPHLESFLGQYFPAGDIPQQARALYLKNKIRIISDANFKPVPVVPALDHSGEPLDLSFAHLRSVSPIHCEYLRNMGVSASMSISIIIDGALWGMIACHHYSPRTLSMPQRVAAEMFGDFFSLHLNALGHKQTLESATIARSTLDGLLSEAARIENINDLLRERIGDFARLIAADGAVIWLDGQLTRQGTTPPDIAIPALARFAQTVADGRIWATHALATMVPGMDDYASEASGIFMIPLSQRPRDYVFLFRREVVQTLDWAGNPEKTYETGPLGERLTPRKSFAIWKQTVHQQSLPWTEREREIGEAARTTLTSVILQHSELLADERAKAEVRQRMLNDELNHRVKNILAVIKSLVAAPTDAGASLAVYVEALRGRIQALSVAHDQVIRGEGGGALRQLLDAELSPYRSTTTTIELQGPDVWMDARSFSVMALVLHELSTNAAKYGALSRPGGRLDAQWNVDAVGACDIVWTESRGPVVTPPSRRGFGTVLVDRSLPFDLGGESNVQYHPDGVIARFRIPPRFISMRGGQVVQSSTERPVFNAPPVDLVGKSVLVVEDQMLIAMDLEQILDEAGLSVLATVTSSRDAIAYLSSSHVPDVAILDVNLGDGTSEPIAQLLTEMGVPFMFATGYGESGEVQELFPDAPVVRKPYSKEAILAQLGRLIR